MHQLKKKINIFENFMKILLFFTQKNIFVKKD